MAKTYNPGKFEQRVQGGATVLVDISSKALNQFYGSTAITSATTVISTSVVKSDSLVFLSYQSLGTPIAIAPYVVTSIAQSASFTVVCSIGASSGTMFWEVKNRR